MATRARVQQLVRRHLDSSAVLGLGPAITAAEAIPADVLVLSPAYADRPGLLVVTDRDLRFISADGTDEVTTLLDRLATVEPATNDGRTVMVILALDGRRTLFLVGDDDWTARLARAICLALDDPAVARITIDGWR